MGLAAIGLVISVVAAKERRTGPFLVGWLVASILALSAGLYFREHYFVFVLPSIALLAAAAVAHPAFSCSAARRPGLGSLSSFPSHWRCRCSLIGSYSLPSIRLPLAGRSITQVHFLNVFALPISCGNAPSPMIKLPC
jgi:hypothetical protein